MGKIAALLFAVGSLMLLSMIFTQHRMSKRMVSTEGSIMDIGVRLGFEWNEYNGNDDVSGLHS